MSRHVLLFAGHMVDGPDRSTPRFPAASEPVARRMIDAAVAQAVVGVREPFGMSGGACGGDILFQEICRAHAIPTELCLALIPAVYVETSVRQGGTDWVERFDQLVQYTSVRVLAEEESPTIWEHSTSWMLQRALDMSDGDLTLIALWDGRTGSGAGGTVDMVKQVRARRLPVIHLDARALAAEH